MTATFKGSEVIVDAIVAKLKAEMATRVAAINTEKNDGITITAPASDRYFVAAQRSIAPGSPAVLVMDGPMSRDGRGESFHEVPTVTRIGVWVRDEDFVEETLARKLQRLSRAVIESLWDGTPKEELYTGTTRIAWRIAPEATIPGPAFDPDGAGTNLAAYYITIFQVNRLEQ